MISRREAYVLKKRCRELEAQLERQRNSWIQEWPGGTHLWTLPVEPRAELRAVIQTARRLGHAIVVIERASELLFYGCPVSHAVGSDKP